MSEITTTENPFFEGFDFLKKIRLEASRLYANSMIDLIKNGKIKEDDLFPSVQYIVDHNPVITFHYARVAYKLIAEAGYMEINVGRRSIVKNPKTLLPPTEQGLNLIHANYPVKHVTLNTIEIDTAFNKSRNKRSILLTPVDENTTSPLMISFLYKKFNNIHHQNLSFSMLYYSHDLQHLLTAVFSVLHQNGAVMVIPAQINAVFKRVLNALYIEFVEVDMDDEGLVLQGLKTASKNHKISTIIMVSKACGPKLITTSAKRVKEIYAIRDELGCKIVELDLNSMWAPDKNNLVIDRAGEAMEDLIYISPVSYLLKNWASLMYVVAKEETIVLIKNRLKADGERATRSIADAAAEGMMNKKIRGIEGNIAMEIVKKVKLILEVFGVSGFWEIIGLKANAGLRFGLRPVFRRLPADTYAKLLEREIVIYDPLTYGGSAEDVILLDLSQYIGQMKFIETLQKIEKACREICVDKEK